ANFTGFTARVASSCRRHADNKLARTPCRSATACTEAPATRLSATIRRRCCAVHLPRRRGATDSGTVSTASSGFAIDLLLAADLAPRQRGSLRRENSFQGPRPHAYVAFHGSVELEHGSYVPRQTVVRVMATQDLIEPLPLVPQRPMPNVAHERGQVSQTAAKPRLLRLPTNLEVALAVARAEVRKPQKIERLRAFPLRAGVPLCKSAKLNELGFARLQGQRKFIKALAEDSLDSFSIFPILEADHEVIDVPDQVGLPFESRLDHLFKPEV